MFIKKCKFGFFYDNIKFIGINMSLAGQIYFYASE